MNYSRSLLFYFFLTSSLPFCFLYLFLSFLLLLHYFLPVRFVRFSLHLPSVSLHSGPQSCFKTESICLSPTRSLIYSCLQHPRHPGALQSLPPLAPRISPPTASTIVTALFDFPIMCPLDPCRPTTAIGPTKGNSYFNSWSIVLRHNSNTTGAVALVQTKSEGEVRLGSSNFFVRRLGCAVHGEWACLKPPY